MFSWGNVSEKQYSQVVSEGEKKKKKTFIR